MGEKRKGSEKGEKDCEKMRNREKQELKKERC